MEGDEYPMTDEHVNNLIPGYALDCLDKAEFEQADAHLATCPVCRAELTAYQAVADQLGMAAPDVTCSDDLEARLMARVQSQPSVRSLPRPSWWERLRDLFRQTAPKWGLVAVALVVVLLMSNVILLRQMRSRSAMPTIVLRGTAAHPDAVGMIVVGVHGDEGALVVDSLPPLDALHQYQLWLIKDGERSSGGVFSVDEGGYAVLWLESEEPLADYEAFGVTVEPAGGSPGPTGDKVLGGKF